MARFSSLEDIRSAGLIEDGKIVFPNNSVLEFPLVGIMSDIYCMGCLAFDYRIETSGKIFIRGSLKSLGEDSPPVNSCIKAKSLEARGDVWAYRVFIREDAHIYGDVRIKKIQVGRNLKVRGNVEGMMISCPDIVILGDCNVPEQYINTLEIKVNGKCVDDIPYTHPDYGL